MDSSRTIKVEFGNGSAINGYEIDKSIYYSKSEISAFFGFARNWAGRLMKGTTKAGKYFQSETKNIRQITIKSSLAGGAGETNELVSGKVFDVLAMSAVFAGSLEAASLVAASFSEVRVSRERDALGLEPLRMSELKESFDEYRRRWYQWYGSTLTDEEWKAGDKVNPTPEDVEEWASKVREVYRIQAAQGSEYVVEERDKIVDYEAMMAEFDV